MVKRLKLWEDEEQDKGMNELLLKNIWTDERNLWTPRFGKRYGRVATQMVEWMDLNAVCH